MLDKTLKLGHRQPAPETLPLVSTGFVPVLQSEGKLHCDDREGASVSVIPAAGSRGFHPVQTVRTRELQDHK